MLDPNHTQCHEQRCVCSRSSISSTLPTEQEAWPRSQCTLGQLWWYYPRGVLTATFRPESHNQEFWLCLQDEGQSGTECGLQHFRFYNSSMQGAARTPLHAPTQGQSPHSSLDLTASGSSTKVYLIYLSYSSWLLHPVV